MGTRTRNIVYIAAGLAACALIGGVGLAGIHVIGTRAQDTTSAPPPGGGQGGQSGGSVVAQPGQGGQSSPPPGKSQTGGYSAQFTNTVRQLVAQGLNLNVDQVTRQVSGGKYITDVSSAQGLSNDQLHTIELNAYQATFDEAVRNGTYSQAQADGYMANYRSKSQSAMNDNVTLLFGGSLSGRTPQG